MAEVDLEALDLSQLKALQKRVDKALASYEGRRRAKAIEAAEAAIKPFGFSLNDLGLTGGKFRKPIEQKYANPSDSEQTWSGRGRRPLWVEEALDNGKTLDDLRIA